MPGTHALGVLQVGHRAVDLELAEHCRRRVIIPRARVTHVDVVLDRDRLVGAGHRDPPVLHRRIPRLRLEVVDHLLNGRVGCGEPVEDLVAELPVEVLGSGSWRLATRRWMLLRTAQQREPLAAHLAAEGRDVVVAPVELVRDAQGEVLTYAPVTEGGPTVVAATDAVAHVGLDGSTRLRDFADVVVGAERLDGIDPSRWLVRLGAPTAG